MTESTENKENPEIVEKDEGVPFSFSDVKKEGGIIDTRPVKRVFEWNGKNRVIYVKKLNWNETQLIKKQISQKSRENISGEAFLAFAHVFSDEAGKKRFFPNLEAVGTADISLIVSLAIEVSEVLTAPKS